MKDNTQNPNISPFISDYLNEKGKLSELGFMLVVDALLLNREDQIPASILEHIHRNAEDRKEVMEYYAVMKQQNTAYLWAYPYYYPKARRRFQPKRHKVYFTSSAILVTILVGIYLMIYATKTIHPKHQEAKTTTPTHKTHELLRKFNPEFLKTDIANRPLIVHKNQACSFDLPSGSQIHIPAQTFVNQKGEIIQGDIEIKYREFHKALEILASGIPMRYDSAGVSYPFESAGMFEIRAYAENKEVFIAPDKNIEVNMASFGEEEDFNHYFLKEEKDKNPQWELLGASRIKKTQEPEIQIREVYKEVIFGNTLGILESNLNDDNALMSDETIVFKIPVNLKKHPELAAFSQTYWEWRSTGIISENPFVNSWVLNEPWDEVELNLLPSTRYEELEIYQSDTIDDIRFSKNEQFILFSSHNGTATLMNLESGEKVFLPGAWTAIFSPDDRYVLTTLDDVKLWSLEGKLLQNFGTPEYGVKSVAFSPDSKYLLITSKENHVRLYDIQGKFIARLWAGTEDYAYALSTLELKNLSSEAVYFTEDSRYVLVKSTKGNLKAWDVKGQVLDWNTDKLSKTFEELQVKHLGTFSQKLLDFNVQSRLETLFTQKTRLLNLLTFTENQRWNKGSFSEKGNYLFTESIEKNNTHFFILWRKSASAFQEEIYDVLLKKDNGSGQGGFLMRLVKADSMRIKLYSDQTILRKETVLQVQQQQKTENKLLRVFEVKKLGIYNVDRIYDAPGMIALQADFRWDHSPKSLSFYPTVYQICGKNQNVVITYHALDWEDFRFDPEDRNYLLAILPDEKIAYFRPEDFAKLKLPEIQNQGKYTFRMHSRKFEGSQDELAQLLK